MTSSAGCSGLIFSGSPPRVLHGVAHGGEVDDGGDAGEVLHEHAGGHEGDLAGGLGLGVPVGEEVDVVGGDGLAVFAAEQIFEQDAEGVGQAGEVDSLAGEGVEAEEIDGGLAGGEGGLAAEGVWMAGSHIVLWRVWRGFGPCAWRGAAGEEKRIRLRGGRRSGATAVVATVAEALRSEEAFHRNDSTPSRD